MLHFLDFSNLLFFIILFIQFFFTLQQNWSFASSGKSSVTHIWYTFILWLLVLFEYSFNDTNNMSLELLDFLLCVKALHSTC